MITPELLGGLQLKFWKVEVYGPMKLKVCKIINKTAALSDFTSGVLCFTSMA